MRIWVLEEQNVKMWNDVKGLRGVSEWYYEDRVKILQLWVYLFFFNCVVFMFFFCFSDLSYLQ